MTTLLYEQAFLCDIYIQHHFQQHTTNTMSQPSTDSLCCFKQIPSLECVCVTAQTHTHTHNSRGVGVIRAHWKMVFLNRSFAMTPSRQRIKCCNLYCSLLYCTVLQCTVLYFRTASQLRWCDFSDSDTTQKGIRKQICDRLHLDQ